MKPLNAKYMKPPKGGLIVKRQALLPPAQYYYRFAHSMVNGQRQNREQIVSGAWWVNADAFHTIRHRSLDSGTHLSSMARSSLAIARRWGGKVDVVVKALLSAPLLGYYGLGTVQSFDESTDDDFRYWMPASDIIQIYVPGLRAKNPETGRPIFADAFDHVEQIKIGWDPF